MTTPLPLHPPGPELAAKNRRLLAERWGWPDGALQACEKIEKLHPGWSAMWSAGGEHTWREPGFYATHPDLRRGSGPTHYLHAETMAEMLAVISDHEPVERWAYRSA